jgi:hypothetical protein
VGNRIIIALKKNFVRGINFATDQNSNIDHLWEHFKQKIHDIMNEFIPTKMINNSKRKLPWINKEIKSLIRKRNKLY